jgi:hypothetical protein
MNCMHCRGRTPKATPRRIAILPKGVTESGQRFRMNQENAHLAAKPPSGSVPATDHWPQTTLSGGIDGKI